jgi:hypothetical protein
MEVLDLPANSPSLTPWENVFGIPARRFYAGNRQIPTMAELRAAIGEAWEEMSWDDI